MKKSANDDSGRRTLTLVLFLFVIPLIAFIAGVGVESNLNSTVRQALRQQYPDKATAIANITVSELCAQAEVRADPNTSDVCELSDHVSLMKSGALWTAGIAFVLLVSIKAAGILCRRRRTLLALLFAPGLHLTMLTLSALTILYAVLGMAAIYYGESALIGRVHFGIMFGLAIFAVVGVVALVKAQLSCVKKAETFELAQRIELERNKALGAFVMELAGKMAAQMPNTVIAGLAPNFYVTEADVVCLNGRLSGRTMYVSLPLCRMLNLEELKAVLAHELAHYKGLDTRFSQRFYPIYRGASQGLMNLASGLSEKGGAGQVVLLPALTALGYFLNSFSEAEREISRERELTADAEAARVGGSQFSICAGEATCLFRGLARDQAGHERGP